MGRGDEEPTEAGWWRPSQAIEQSPAFVRSDMGSLWVEAGINMALYLLSEGHSGF